MFLPGMNYQDSSWEPCKKALGLASLATLRHISVARLIDDACFEQNLHDVRHHMSATLLRMSSYLSQFRNLHDRDAFTLASDLVLAFVPLYLPVTPLTKPTNSTAYAWPLAERPSFFVMFIEKVRALESLTPAESVLRKIANEVFADLRDEMDVQGFRAETGEPMTVNYLRNIRKVDQASNAVKAVLANWSNETWYASLILGYPVLAEPIEHRHLLHGGRCKAEWLLRWSEHFGHFHQRSKRSGNSPVPIPGKSKKTDVPLVGCFHTRSKQFVASLENIGAILKLIDPVNGRYQQLMPGGGNYTGFSTLLQEIQADVVDDEHHASRLSRLEPDAPHDQEAQESDSAIDVVDMDDQVSELNAVADLAVICFDIDNEDESGPNEAPSGDAESDTAFAPGNTEIADDETTQPWALLRQYLQDYPLPLQIGVLRELSKKLDSDDLLDAFDAMGIFDAWGLERDVTLLTNVELARRLPAMPNGKQVNPGTVKNWIAKAQQEFMARAMQAMANSRYGGTGSKGETT